MAPYWRQREPVRLRFPGCTRCTGTSVQPGCGSIDPLRNDPNLRQALLHLFGAMIHDHEFVIDAFAEVELTLRRFASFTQTPSLYCVLVGFFEDEIGQRGKFHSWPYADVDDAVTLACSAAWVLAEDLGRTASADLLDRASQDLSALAELMERLCRQDCGPLPACGSCQSPCRYRFDMAQLSRERQFLQGDFRSFLSGELDVDALAKFLWHESDARFASRDAPRRRGAAFCLFAQEIARLGCPLGQQRDLAPFVAAALEKMETE